MTDSRLPQRLAWIDIAKGIGIITVVVAHVLLHSPQSWANVVATTIYLFHMPLFFLLAGMTLRPEPLSQFAPRKTLSFVLPYIVFLALLGAPALMVTCTLGTPIPLLGIDRCTVLPAKLLLGGSSLGGIFGAFWFIPCLLGALILAQSLLALPRRTRPAAVSLLALAAFALPSMLPASTAVLSLGVAPMATILVLVGHALGKTAYWRSRPALALNLALGAAAILAQIPFDMKAGHYGPVLFGLAGAVALSCLLMRLSQKLADSVAPAAILSALGKSSLTILYLHQAVHLGLRQFSQHNELLLVALSLAIPLLLNRPLRQALNRAEFNLNLHLSRKSPAA